MDAILPDATDNGGRPATVRRRGRGRAGEGGGVGAGRQGVAREDGGAGTEEGGPGPLPPRTARSRFTFDGPPAELPRPRGDGPS
ncbi:hypothetical protein GCM10017667_45490 [Streptomyces filamentosus]|uniref:Uncharacterized protein n=1 Tax=Streptomyces filamentosus TaxID=67294 RepID=A0A919BSI3_STRFL|nr:hypothetical protein GCM10017667_45490 [Streptomyces filamentosus]